MRRRLVLRTNELRVGADEQGRGYLAAAELAGGAITFIPFPEAMFWASDVATHSASVDRVVDQQRRQFHDLARGWAEQYPRSAAARELLAIALDLLADPAALEAITGARALAADAAEAVRLGAVEVALRLKLAFPEDREELRRGARSRKRKSTPSRASSRSDSMACGRPTPAGRHADAARWGFYDGRHHFEVACGGGWCSLARDNAKPPKGDNSVRPPGKTGNAKRMWSGWYDQQPIAVPGAAGLEPGPQADLIPTDLLDTASMAAFERDYTHVASVVLRGQPGVYEAKYGFANYDSVGVESDIYLRRDPTEPDEEKGWHAKVVTPLSSGTITKHLKVTREAHTRAVPAMARWGWREDDETAWTKCAQGCCEILGEEFTSPPSPGG